MRTHAFYLLPCDSTIMDGSHAFTRFLRAILIKGASQTKQCSTISDSNIFIYRIRRLVIGKLLGGCRDLLKIGQIGKTGSITSLAKIRIVSYQIVNNSAKKRTTHAESSTE